jgi:hypothetical protein
MICHAELVSASINWASKFSQMIAQIFFRNIVVLFLIVTVISVSSISVMGESFAQELKTERVAATAMDDNPVYAVRDKVLSYFYPVSGVIKSVENGRVWIELRSDKKFKKGARFSVFREGIPFYHPVTKEPIGKSEKFVGSIEIEEVSKESYLCRVVNGNPEVGDIVRITSSRIKLAFFQDRKSEWTISEVFYNSLKDSGRFDLVESYTKTYDPEELSMLAKELGAQAVLLFSTPVKEENLFLNVKLFWSEDATTFADIEEMVGTGIVKELTSEAELIPIATAGGVPLGSYEFTGGKFIAMGDIDGNGERELVVSDGNNIRIYSYKKEPREIWLINGSPAEEHLSIDVLDLNNNGRAEIFVTSLRNENVIKSFTLEYEPLEGYRKIWEKSDYAVRVMGKTLLMQAFTSSKAFTGPVYSGVWKDGSYQIDKAFTLPDGVDIYGFTYVEWSQTRLIEQNRGHSYILAFDDDGYLNLYSGNELIWRSKGSHGKFDIAYNKKSPSVVNPEEKWFVKGRLVTVKTERGQEVIVIKKIPYLSRVTGLGYKRAEVYSFWWDGGIMDESLILSGISGTVTDYWVEGDKLLVIATQNLLTFLTKTLSGDFERNSILYHYNLKGK